MKKEIAIVLGKCKIKDSVGYILTYIAYDDMDGHILKVMRKLVSKKTLIDYIGTGIKALGAEIYTVGFEKSIRCNDGTMFEFNKNSGCARVVYAKEENGHITYIVVAQPGFDTRRDCDWCLAGIVEFLSDRDLINVIRTGESKNHQIDNIKKVYGITYKNGKAQLESSIDIIKIKCESYEDSRDTFIGRISKLNQLMQCRIEGDTSKEIIEAIKDALKMHPKAGRKVDIGNTERMAIQSIGEVKSFKLGYSGKINDIAEDEYYLLGILCFDSIYSMNKKINNAGDIEFSVRKNIYRKEFSQENSKVIPICKGLGLVLFKTIDYIENVSTYVITNERLEIVLVITKEVLMIDLSETQTSKKCNDIIIRRDNEVLTLIERNKTEEKMIRLDCVGIKTVFDCTDIGFISIDNGELNVWNDSANNHSVIERHGAELITKIAEQLIAKRYSEEIEIGIPNYALGKFIKNRDIAGLNNELEEYTFSELITTNRVINLTSIAKRNKAWFIFGNEENALRAALKRENYIDSNELEIYTVGIDTDKGFMPLMLMEYHITPRVVREHYEHIKYIDKVYLADTWIKTDRINRLVSLVSNRYVLSEFGKKTLFKLINSIKFDDNWDFVGKVKFNVESMDELIFLNRLGFYII